MNKEFIPYEQALELKQLGFDQPCHRGWDKNMKIWYHPDSDVLVDNPTYSQAFRFFREKYELTCWVYNSHIDRYYYTILQYGRLVKANSSLETYEEAEHACLLKLIELVKQK